MKRLILLLLTLTLTACVPIPESTPTASNDVQMSNEFGASMQFGDLDELGRPTFAWIQVMDHQEPGENGVKRPKHINTDPEGWVNYKVDTQWVYDRTHLVGWQFSGVQDDPRNLVIGTRYTNRGVAGNGSDPSNPDGMLFYESQLDDWLKQHPDYTLDLFAMPIYEGEEMVPRYIYLRWFGLDASLNRIPINLGGLSTPGEDSTYEVYIPNILPNHEINYTNGRVK